MNYTKLVFSISEWPDVYGKTLTLDFKRGELEVRTLEGIRVCSITMSEGDRIQSKT